jgi:hypothetical protein
MVGHAFNTSTGRLRWKSNKLKNDLGYTVRPCFKKSKISKTSSEVHDNFLRY